MALGAMVPGPTTALVVRRSAMDGFRAAVPLVLGIETGLYTFRARRGGCGRDE